MEKIISKPNLWIAGYDLHFPKVHKPTLNAMLEFIARNRGKIAGFIAGGDFLDNEEISHHTSGKPLFRPTGSYLRNHKNFQAQVLDPLHAVLPRTAERVWLTGNHEKWSEELVESQPELKGLVENHLLLDVEGQGWQYLPCGERFKLGKLSVIHGDQIAGSANVAKKAVDLYAGSVLFGHFHSPQSHTRVLPYDISQKWIGVCAPCLGTTNPGYLRNRANAWLNGFVVIELHPNGNFNIVPIITSNGMFSYGGVLYGGK